MEDSNKQHLEVQEVLAPCSHQAKRIKKLTRRESLVAKQSKIRNENIQLRQSEESEMITSGFPHYHSEQNNEPTTVEIQSKLRELFSSSKSDEIVNMSPIGPGRSNRTSKFSSQKLRINKRIPLPPSFVISCSYDDMSSDDVSDSESDFFPEWSSAESCSSSVGSRSEFSTSKLDNSLKDEVLLSDDDILKFHEEELDIPIDDDNGVFPMEEGKFSPPNEFDRMISQPIPAAGNDLPGSSSQHSKTPSSLPIPEDVTMKPYALRRVKSMVLENDLNDAMETGKRLFVLQQKRINTSLTAQPSPLLSTNDITQLKKSPSQTSTKYSLKRSRSNISAELSSCKRTELGMGLEKDDVILEENECDVEETME